MAMMHRRSLPYVPMAAAMTVCLLWSAALVAQRSTSWLNSAAIAYAKTTPTEAIAQLQQRMETGAVALEYDADRGYLPSLLKHLGVPSASQGLVFSKTSLQVSHIAPWSPRAVYFNDSVYIGWVQDGPIMEIASIDPKLGAVFYTLSQEQTARPTFQRETTTCLMCHNSAAVPGDVPGLIVRSMYPDRYGYSIAPVGSGVTTDQSPLAERWGGWYVTGTVGRQTHAGNILAPLLTHDVDNVKSYMARVDLGAGSRVTDLETRFDTDKYLTPHSDLVALLVLAHQATVHNLITRAGYEARTGRRFEATAEELVQALLFVNEAPLTEPVAGSTDFAERFADQGPRDSQGRSLRDLDLRTRMFRYPLSYLIYSEQFNALPIDVKSQVYTRLRQVLRGEDVSAPFAHLTAPDRAAIVAIVSATKPDLHVSLTAEP